MSVHFVGSVECGASENPMFILVDEETGNKYARMVVQKGVGERHEVEWLMLDAVKTLNVWGHTGTDIIVKSDGEPAITVVRDAIGNYLGP